ncbi:hypothetical protein D3C87_1662280 [compost metagenome]
MDLSFGFFGFGTSLAAEAKVVKMSAYDDGILRPVVEEANHIPGLANTIGNDYSSDFRGERLVIALGSFG